MNPIKTDLLQGTLDLLILKTVALEAAARLRNFSAHSADFARRAASAARLALSGRCTDWSGEAGLRLSGVIRKIIAARNFTKLRAPDGVNWKWKKQIGSD